jgi:glycine oxidase
LLIALQEALNDSSVTWLEQHTVHSIDASDSGARIVAGNQTVLADLVIDCRGYGAASKQTASKALSDLRAVRGELFQLFAPDVNLSRPIRLMHPRYQLYIAPKTKGFYVVGATEIESDDTSEVTVRSAMELLSAAYSVHPGFAEANIRQHVTQLRPAFSDNQPKISVQSRLIQVNGLYRHGYLISPVVLKQVLALVNEMNGTDGNFRSDANLPYSHWLPIKELS